MASFLNLSESSNARTNWITIIVGAALGALSFFKITPDLETAQSLGVDVSNLISYVKVGNWTLVFTVVLNLYNTISHIVKNKR